MIVEKKRFKLMSVIEITSMLLIFD